MGITREVSTAIRKLSFIFGLACLGACSATDKPSMDDDRETNCVLDSDCGPGESCDASECVPVDAPPDLEQVTEADLVELIEESTVADIAVILGGPDGIQFTHSKGDLDTNRLFLSPLPLSG